MSKLQRVDSIFDIPALKTEYTEYETMLTKSEKLLQDLFAATKENKTSSLAGFTQAVEKLSDAIDNSTKSYNEAVKKNKELVSTARDIITTSEKITSTTDKQTASNNKAAQSNKDIVASANDIITSNIKVGATYKEASGDLDTNIRQQLRYKSTLYELQGELKKLQKEHGATGDSATELEAKEKALQDAMDLFKNAKPAVQQKNSAAIEDLQRQMDELQKLKAANLDAAASSDPLIQKQIDIARTIEAIKQANTELQRTIRLQIKENNSESDSIDQMSAQYDRLYQVYRKLSSVERESEFGVDLKNNLDQLSEKINKLKTDAGNFSGNVGRYASSLKAPFELLENKLEEIRANLKNGIGLGGGTDTSSIAAANDAVDLLSTSLEKAKKTGTSLTQQVNILDDTLNTFITTTTKGDTTNTSFITELGTEIGNVKEQMKEAKAQADTLTSGVKNYAGSFSQAFEVLTSELDIVRQKIAVTGKDTPGFAKLEKEERLLTKLTQDLGRSFKTPTQELRAFQNAAKTLGQEFGITSDKFQDFVSEVGSKKDEIDDIQGTINFQASDTKYIDGMIGAVNGLAGIYGVAESTSVLFGEQSEDLARSMQKLQAILTLVNSLQAVMNSLQSEGAAMQTLLAGKTLLLNTAKEIELALSTKAAVVEGSVAAAKIGSVAATEAGVIATEANVVAHRLNVAAMKSEIATTTLSTVAQEGFTVATEASEAATLSLRATLIASGIGIIILGLVAGIAYLISEIEDWDQSIKDNAKNIKDWSEDIIKQNQLINDQIDMITKAKQAAIDKLKSDLANADALGQSQEKTLAQQILIAEKEKEIANEKLRAHPDIIKDINDEEMALKSLTDQQKKAQDEVVRLNNLRRQGKTTVDVQEVRQKFKVSREGEMIKTGGTEVVTIKVNINDVIDKNKTIVKDNEEAATASKQALTELKSVEKDYTDASEKYSVLRMQQNKLENDQRRRLALETVRIEGELIQNQNSFILNDERSTEAQRIAALKSNAEQRRKIISAELSDVKNDPTKQGTVEETIAIKKAAAERRKVTLDTNKQIFDVEEAFRKRRLAAELEVLKINLEYDKSIQDKIASNSRIILNDRLSAVKKYSDDQATILEKEYEYTKATTVLSKEELLRLEADYNTKRIVLAAETQERVLAVLKSEISQEQQLRSDAAQELQRIVDSTDLIGTQNYSAEVQALNTSLQERKISYTEYIKTREKLDQAYSISSMENELKGLKMTVSLYKDNSAEILAIQEELINQKNLLQIAETEQDRLAAAAYIELLDLRLKAAKAYGDERIKLLKQIAEKEKAISDGKKDNEIRSQEDILKNLAENIGAISDIINNSLSIIGELSAASAEAQKSRIDDLERDQQAHYEAEKERITRSSDDEETKAEKLQELEAARQRQKEDNDRAQRRIDIERARFERAQNIANIIGSTSLAVVNALTQVKTLGPLAIPLAVTIGALGLAQLAKAVSVPLPKYKHGRGYGKEEDAILGDGGVSEYLVHEDGSIERTPPTDTLYHLKPKDRVVKDKEAMRRELSSTAIPVQHFNVQQILNGRSGGEIGKREMEAFTDRIVGATEKMVAAVDSIELHSTVITKEGWRKQSAAIRDTSNWIKDKVKGS